MYIANCIILYVEIILFDELNLYIQIKIIIQSKNPVELNEWRAHGPLRNTQYYYIISRICICIYWSLSEMYKCIQVTALHYGPTTVSKLLLFIVLRWHWVLSATPTWPSSISGADRSLCMPTHLHLYSSEIEWLVYTYLWVIMRVSLGWCLYFGGAEECEILSRVNILSSHSVFYIFCSFSTI